MAKIHVLSEHLTNMIAAGEVVERPAGIVKECVENSIDAGATVIEVEVYQGGIERIVITDDGCGMDHEDAHLAFRRHATSKCIQKKNYSIFKLWDLEGKLYQVLLLLPKLNCRQAMVKKELY